MRLLVLITLTLSGLSQMGYLVFPAVSSSNNQIHYYDKDQLPTGGEFIVHPKNVAVNYYFTNRQRMWRDESNFQKIAGLYISNDHGSTWKRQNNNFDFLFLFIHPDNGILYAIINFRWHKTDENGFLSTYHANKVIRSDEGKKWRDITGGPGFIASIIKIIQDPDYPGRVCLIANVIRGYTLQSTDDSYSEWTWFTDWEWPRRHNKEIIELKILQKQNEKK